jgi:IS30 family transposase
VLGIDNHTVLALVRGTGGVGPRPRVRAARALSIDEREEISRGLAEGASLREIAQRLGRAASTVCREVQPNCGSGPYRATTADRRAWKPRGAPSQTSSRGAQRFAATSRSS